MNIFNHIDHTLLKPTATLEDIQELCKEAVEHQFFSVCINSCHVPLAYETLKKSEVKVCSVVGFPLGAMSTKAKLFEAEQAIKDGASEIDMVMNIGWLKSDKKHKVLEEINGIKNVIGNHILKVIIEACYLTDDEKRTACKLTVEGGADFVKTSTGFGSGGATFEDILLLKEVVKGKVLLKASGGIKDYETAKKYIDLGVVRLGTSSGVAIMKGFKSVASNNPFNL